MFHRIPTSWILTVAVALTGFAESVYAACSSPAANAGASQYNSTLLRYEYCDGLNWVSMRGGGLKQAANLTSSGTYLDNPKKVAIYGNYLYVSDTTNPKIAIFDITNAASPIYVGNYTHANLGNMADIEVTGNYLVTMGDARLNVLDLTDPVNPVMFGSVVTSGVTSSPAAIGIFSDIVYVNAHQKMFIVDITTKSAPVIRGNHTNTDLTVVGGGVDLVGTLLYLSGGNGLHVYDVSNLNSPTLLGSNINIQYNGSRALKVVGNYAFVGGGNYFTISDISNPAAPVLLRQLSGAVAALVKSGNTLYAGSSGNGSGLTLWDVSTPANPVAILFQGIASVSDLAISGTKMAVADPASRMVRVYDNSATPTVRGLLDYSNQSGTATFNRGIAVGNILIAQPYDEGIFAFDISNPAAMTIVSQKVVNPTNTFSTGTAFDGTYVYTNTANGAVLTILDYSVPATPTVVSTTFHSAFGGFMRMRAVGNYLYVLGASNFYIFDVSNKSNVTLVGSVAAGSSFVFEEPLISGNYAYVFSNTTFQVIDISNPASPSIVGAVTDATKFAANRNMDKAGNYVYVTSDGCQCLTTIDVTTPTAPAITSNLTAIATIARVKASGTKLYVGTNSSVRAYDLTTPSTPALLGIYGSGGASAAIHVSGTTVFGLYASSGGPLRSINFSTPASPTLISSVTQSGNYENVSAAKISGNYAYFSVPYGKIDVYDVTSATSPSLIRTVTGASVTSVTGMDISGFYLYATGPSYLTILDTTTPALTSVVGTVSNANLTGVDVKVSGNYAYVLNASRLATVDITNKAAPTYVTSFTNAQMTGCSRLEIDGAYLYATCSTSQTLVVISLANPAAPAFSGAYQNSTYFNNPTAVVIKGSYALVFTGSSQLAVLVNVSNPAAPAYVKTINMPMYGAGAKLVGNLVYVSGTSNCTYTQLDVTSMLSPTVFAKADVSVCGSRIDVSGNRLVVASNTQDAIAVADLGPWSYYINLKFSQNYTGTYASPYYMSSIGNTVYTISPSSGRLNTIDMSVPASPSLISSQFESSFVSAGGIMTEGTTAYIHQSYYTLSAWDLTTPTNIVMLGGVTAFPQYSGIQRIRKSGNYLYTTNFGSQFTAANFTNPASPVISSTFTNAALTSGSGMDISGNYAFICNWGASGILLSVNISVPTAMTLAGSTTDTTNLSNCRDLTASGNYVYTVSQTGSKFAVWDISTPGTPTLVASLTNASFASAQRIEKNGNTVVVMSTSAVVMIDVSVPTAPFIMDNTGSIPNTGGLAIGAGYAAVTLTSSNTLRSYQLSPTLVLGTCSTAGSYEYNSGLAVMEFCDGTSRFGMSSVAGAGGAGCSSPAAVPGALQYNTTPSKMQFCDGTNWVDTGN